jgi:hypothetical protein
MHSISVETVEILCIATISHIYCSQNFGNGPLRARPDIRLLYLHPTVGWLQVTHPVTSAIVHSQVKTQKIIGSITLTANPPCTKLAAVGAALKKKHGQYRYKVDPSSPRPENASKT